MGSEAGEGMKQPSIMSTAVSSKAAAEGKGERHRQQRYHMPPDPNSHEKALLRVLSLAEPPANHRPGRQGAFRIFPTPKYETEQVGGMLLQ